MIVMKKIYSTFLSLILISGIFSCENKKEETTTTTTTTETETETMSSDSTAMSGTEPKPAEQEVMYKVDTSKSDVTWVGKKITGKHKGKIKIQGGEVKTVNNS